jgi:RHS repeat-associated protein
MILGGGNEPFNDNGSDVVRRDGMRSRWSRQGTSAMSVTGATALQRLVATVTLFAFVVTTVSPSLAWAAGRAPVAAAARVVDEVGSDELAAGRAKAEVVLEREDAVPTKVRPSVDDLREATGPAIEKLPAGDAPAQPTDTEALALPTGADKSGVTSQAISVPKGSGTIQGLGESFSAQLSTGIATFSVPFALPAARGGAQPSLGLSYSSGSGAGLAGMGWSVGVPFIARQTDRGLPGYDDRAEWHANQDRFVFNGGQELVPICVVKSTTSCVGPTGGGEKLLPSEQMPVWAVNHQYFRPRVEGSFLRFFWSDTHLTWRVQDKSGVTMELGVPLDGSGSRAALEVNPDSKDQIYRWHLVRQYDTYGDANPAAGAPKPVNVVVYRYTQDGGQAYLSDIFDTTPAAAPTTTVVADFAHHTRLEYEPRTDPTESYRSGWLIRQTRRLKRVDVTSKTIAGASAARRLVRRYHLDYDARFHTSYLASVQVEGRCATTEAQATPETDGVLGDTQCADVASADNWLPPMTFGYSHVSGFTTAGSAVESSLAGYEAFDARLMQMGGDPPHSVDEELTDYFDINGDALPDVLVTAPGTYGDDFGVFFNSQGGTVHTFGAVSQLGVAGVLGANSGTIKLSNQNVAPLDFDGDGLIDFLHMPKVKTYSAYTPKLVAGQWRLVGRAIDAADEQSPKIDLGQDAAETRVVDVNFDGLVDVVVSTGTELQTFLSLGRLPGGDGQFGNGRWQSKDTASLSNDPIGRCVPYSGTPVRFSDSDIQLADMNGDGIQDILRLRRGDFRYWPGRGNGFWGTGELNDCPAGSFGDKRYLVMDESPYYSDIQGTSLRVDDVNGDGLDDLVQVRFDAVDVWINVDGKSWTKRSILDGTPQSPSFANRVRLMDINGSGTRDIVWGNGKKYQFMDLAGGERPGLLVKVENGLGKSTSIEYESSTEQMLAAERGGACSGNATTFSDGWCSKAPTVSHVVKRVTESDNLDMAGLGVGRYVTEYTYRDPVFEGRQREFRGFKRARSKRIGDANSPTDFTESTFLLGECEDETPDDSVDDCAVSERWRDNPKEALKGLPVVTERYDESGVYLSTESTTYRLRHLYDGLDGRAVRHAFQSKKRTTLYDTAAGASLAAATDEAAVVELETQAPPPVTGLGNRLCKIDPAQPGTSLPSATVVPTHAANVPLRAGTGYATIESASYVDAFGNQLIGVAKGCVAGLACPTTIAGIVADEQICSFSDAILPAGQETNWLYRSATSWVRGSVQTDIRKRTTTTYSAKGAPTKTVATLTGTVALERFHELSRVVSPTPASAAQDGERVLGVRVYDEFGNLEKETGPTNSEGVSLLGRCRKVTYDVANYKQLPMSETVFTGGCDVGGLTTIAGYDRGLGLVATVTDMNDKVTTVSYDGFGRLTGLMRPPGKALGPGQTALPSVKISYSLPSAQERRAFSVIHTKTQDGTVESADQYLESYAFIDGMGRSRVGLSEADPSAGDEGNWIVSAVAEFDAKGAVRRKYLPFFLNATPPAYPLVAPPATRYGEQRYDAFGRQVQTYDVDGTVTLQSRYHALSTDLYDAADLYPGPHQGSFASTRTDGHGRTIETTERVHDGGTLDHRYVQTQFLPSGEPSVITRYRAGSLPVVRWMRYDSLGRMVLNVDPHATANFNPNPQTSATPAPSGLKTWRYAYNDAGDLVGTSDARGCGQNFYYDGAGRLYGEDYSPCTKEHTLYSSPSLGSTPYNVASLPSSNGLEVFYQYDTSPATPVAPPPTGQPYSTENLQGRLAAVHDRAATTWFSYDARGRGTSTWRRVSIFGTNVNTAPSFAANISSRYTTKWFHKEQSYDAADRPISETTGASSTELLASNGESIVSTAYTKRGTLKNVGSSYGTLVSSIDRSADGLVGELVFGDAAGTTTTMRYDSRRRLASVQTSRSVPTQWSSPPASYSPAPSLDPNAPTTFQLLLQDLDYTYDVVGNPTEVRDWRTPEEWPESAKPVSRRFEYDDLYRLTRVDYTYSSGSDNWVSPHAADLSAINDSRRATVPGHRIFQKRAAWQTFAYDWLGNTKLTDDDQHALLDRSLGTIVSNATASATTSKPYQFKSASQPASAAGPAQNASAMQYDAAGNLTWFTSGRSTVPCTKAADCVNLQFFYLWDEVGRLVYASRPSSVGPFVRYLYDANDERVFKQYQELVATGQGGPEITTLYVFDSLEARRTTYDAASQQYIVNASSEVPYLSANGMRLARLHYEPPAKGEPRLETPGALHAPNLHVMLTLPDHLGSSSLIIDHATSELVEARTYQPYGATESDYRPDRWKGFREDYGFTGKEEDVEVGLQYFGKRYLSPYLGRWISADPLAVHVPGKADLNLYAYVSGQVLKAIDPVGLDKVTNQHEIEQAMFDQSGGQLGANHRYTPSPAPAVPASNAGDGSGGAGPSSLGETEKSAIMSTRGEEAARTNTGIDVVVAAPDPAGRMEDSMTGGVEGGPGVLPEVPRLQLHLGRVVPGFYDENARRWQSTEIQECSVPSPRSILPAVAARGAGAGRVFWSGGETAKDAAAAFASRTGGTTLEMTSAGRALESSSLPWAEAKPLWQSASGDFAKGAQGNVDVFFSRAARSDSIWTTIERPALQSNPGVTGITVHLTVIP